MMGRISSGPDSETCVEPTNAMNLSGFPMQSAFMGRPCTVLAILTTFAESGYLCAIRSISSLILLGAHHICESYILTRAGEMRTSLALVGLAQ